jgi:hypothetical protein
LYKVILIKLFNLFLAFNVSVQFLNISFVTGKFMMGKFMLGCLYESFLAEEQFYALLGLSVPAYVPVPYRTCLHGPDISFDHCN